MNSPCMSSPSHSATNQHPAQVDNPSGAPIATGTGKGHSAAPFGHSGASTPVDTCAHSTLGSLADCDAAGALSLFAPVANDNDTTQAVRTTVAEFASDDFDEVVVQLAEHEVPQRMHEQHCDTAGLLSHTASVTHHPTTTSLCASHTVMLSHTLALENSQRTPTEDSHRRVQAHEVPQLHAQHMHDLSLIHI